MSEAAPADFARDLAASPPSWLPAPGEPSRPGLSFARAVRLRNFAGLPFWVSASQEACARIVERAREEAEREGFDSSFRLADLSPVARGVLRERGLLPEHPARFEGKRDFKRIFLGRNPREHALLGEVEHWTRVSAGPDARVLDDAEDEAETGIFSGSPDLGFLTSDPGFAGAGLRFEAGVHLPGLVATRGIVAAQRALGAMGFELRPERSAGAASAGFRLLSRGGLGWSAAALKARFAARLESLLRREAEALEEWRGLDPARFDDAVHRAEALLRGARRIEEAELSGWIERLRAGRRLGLLDHLSDAALETLSVRARPFHLAAENPDAPPEEEGRLRAALAAALPPG